MKNPDTIAKIATNMVADLEEIAILLKNASVDHDVFEFIVGLQFQCDQIITATKAAK